MSCHKQKSWVGPLSCCGGGKGDTGRELRKVVQASAHELLNFNEKHRGWGEKTDAFADGTT